MAQAPLSSWVHKLVLNEIQVSTPDLATAWIARKTSSDLSKSNKIAKAKQQQPRVELGNIRNVKYTDADLQDVEVYDKNDKVLAFGGVEVTDNVKEVLTLNPKMKIVIATPVPPPFLPPGSWAGWSASLWPCRSGCRNQWSGQNHDDNDDYDDHFKR